jgi:hypothetical protein
MKAYLRKPVVFFLSLLALFALGAIFYILSSGPGSSGQPAFSTATIQPGIVDRQLTATSPPYPIAPSRAPYLPPSTETPVPYPYIIPNTTATAIFASSAKTLTAEPTNVASQTALAEQNAAYLQETIKEMKRLGAIMLEDNGRTFTYFLTDRFFVFLDDEKYPVDSLDCKPEGIIGYVSNGSFRGPDLYPVYYEAASVGSCTLKDHDFAVKIVVVDLPTPAPGVP